MNKKSTVISIVGLLMLAVAIIFKMTLQAGPEIGQSALSIAIATETVAAFGLAWLGYAVFRKGHRRQKKPARNREPIALLRPLRRLFVSVWP